MLETQAHESLSHARSQNKSFKTSLKTELYCGIGRTLGVRNRVTHCHLSFQRCPVFFPAVLRAPAAWPHGPPRGARSADRASLCPYQAQGPEPWVSVGCRNSSLPSASDPGVTTSCHWSLFPRGYPDCPPAHHTCEPCPADGPAGWAAAAPHPAPATCPWTAPRLGRVPTFFSGCKNKRGLFHAM